MHAFTSPEFELLGLVALAGAATNNVKRRQQLQRYLDSGAYDESVELLGATRETFLDGVDVLAADFMAEDRRQQKT